MSSASPMSLSPNSPSTPLSTPQNLFSTLETTQQLQRVEILHQQLKAEAARAQEFLLKLRRGEELQQSQSQLTLQNRSQNRQKVPQEAELPASQKRRPSPTVQSNGGQNQNGGLERENLCKCSCPHHPPLQPPPHNHNHPHPHAHTDPFSKSRLSPLSADGAPTRVDEREVRDLEKRVRGLEGRVRGFEGLPPDREKALIEVERLRRELEGLARRREGLFGGLDMGDEGLGVGTAQVGKSMKRFVEAGKGRK